MYFHPREGTNDRHHFIQAQLEDSYMGKVLLIVTWVTPKQLHCNKVPPGEWRWPPRSTYMADSFLLCPVYIDAFYGWAGAQNIMSVCDLQ